MNRSSNSWLVNPDGTQGYSWNPILGCSPAHVGCKFCYAARLASTRLAHLPEYGGLTKRCPCPAKHEPAWTGEVRFFPERLAEPLRRRKPSSIFPVDMGDLFHEKVTNEQIAAVFGVMAATPQHRYFVLTKRARRMREWFAWVDGQRDCGSGRWQFQAEACRGFAIDLLPGESPLKGYDRRWPLPNISLLVSVSDQRTADELIPELLQTQAAMRGVSLEPMVGPVDLTRMVLVEPRPPHGPGVYLNALTGLVSGPDDVLPKLDWVIVGGESGSNARPCHVEWIRSVVRQCAEAKVQCWVKQYGSNAIGDGYDLGDETVRELDAAGCDILDTYAPDMLGAAPKSRLPMRSRAGANPSEWHPSLRVRQRPVGW